ncbi:GNAT family N-acetyltransferase [Azospirillum melinis]
MPAGYPPEVMDRVLPIITRSNPALLGAGTYYLAEAADGTPAGCGGWSFDWPGEPARPQQAGLAHVRHFATHPGWLRRGVGRALFRRCRRGGCIADAVLRQSGGGRVLRLGRLPGNRPEFDGVSARQPLRQHRDGAGPVAWLRSAETENGAPSCRMARRFHVGPLVPSPGAGEGEERAFITPPGWRAAGSPARPDGAASPSEPPARSGRVHAASR